MEDIDGGLHPAVDGQSLDEDDEVVLGPAVLYFVSCLGNFFLSFYPFVFNLY